MNRPNELCGAEPRLGRYVLGPIRYVPCQGDDTSTTQCVEPN